jgi:hypothetical protein
VSITGRRVLEVKGGYESIEPYSKAVDQSVEVVAEWVKEPGERMLSLFLLRKGGGVGSLGLAGDLGVAVVVVGGSVLGERLSVAKGHLERLISIIIRVIGGFLCE